MRHSDGLRASLANVVAPADPTDADFKQTVLLLHGDGTNGARNNTFIDSSSNNFTITRNGNTTQGTFTPFSAESGKWSNFFDGSGDWLTVPSNSAFTFGTNDFTIECFAYVNSSANCVFIDFRGFDGTTPSNAGPRLQIGYSTTANKFTYGQGTNDGFIVSNVTVVPNTWYHIAATRSGNTVRLFVNGSLEGSATTTASLINNGAVIGAFNSTNALLRGNVSNIRVINGTALYTSNFTPPTSPLTAVTNTVLLTCQDNRFRDGSSNNFTITRNGDVRVTPFSPFAPSAAYSASVNGGSGYFDGSGDYLQTASGTNLNLGSGDFTVEFWAYFNSISNDPHVFDQRITTTSSAAPIMLVSSTGVINTYRANGIGINSTAAGVVTAGQWVHIAWVRSGTNFNLYRNGQLVSGPVSLSYNFSAANPVRLGAGNTAQGPVNGYVTDFRYVRGTAVYTSNFTPPTAPLTAITNTSLLLNFTNAEIIDSTGKNVLETQGGSQINTTTKKYGTGSIRLDSSDDVLIIPPSPETIIGTAPFTIECWVNAPSFTNNNAIVSKGTTTLSTNWFLRTNTSAQAQFLYNGSTAITGSTTLSTNTWHHIAVVGTRTAITLYVNGVQDATVSYTYNYTENSRVGIGIGRTTTGSTPDIFVDDLRITHGVARYTSAFTPPTAAFADK